MCEGCRALWRGFFTMKKREKKIETEKKGRKTPVRRFLRILLFVLLGITAGAVLTVAGTGIYLRATVDTEADAALFEACRASRTTRLYYNTDRNGEVYRAKEWEGQRVSGGEQGLYCPLSAMPKDLKNAFIAAEDHRFFEHDGVDWLRTGKALLNSVFRFDSRFGGSGITQQLIKNISGENEISAWRKIKEAYRAIALERRYSKEEILEVYLNIVPMGDNCIGVASGAERCFGKKPSELTLRECAALCAVIKAPARYDPLKNPENNRTRSLAVLGEMRRYGLITEEEEKTAAEEPLALNPQKEKTQEAIRSWYTETVLADVEKDLCQKLGYSKAAARRAVYGGGLEIYTLADPGVQKTLERVLENLSPADKIGFAGVVIDPANGDLLAIVGGAGEKTGNLLLNQATVAHAPGSALKPLSVYAPALDRGIINWATVMDDVPLSFGTPEVSRVWPRNSPAVYQGLCDMATAVATSKNTVAVRVLRELGAENSYATLTRSLGMSTLIRKETDDSGNRLSDLGEASLALGQLTYGVSVRELCTAYTALAGDGHCLKGRTYLAVYDGKGKVLLTNEPEKTKAFSAETASIMTKMLEETVTRGTAIGVNLPGQIPVAGKTGTTSGSRDKWFVGYSPYYLCGIWCGSTDGKSAVAGKPQLAVFNTVMRNLHREIAVAPDRMTAFPVAEGVYSCRYCCDGGGLLSETCLYDPRGSRAALGWFTAATMPSTPCTCHIPVLYNAETGGIVEADGEYFCNRESLRAELLRQAGLIRVTDRLFPEQIKIQDAQYVYRPLSGNAPGGTRQEPYFITAVPQGKYVGISDTPDGVQFNAVCRPADEWNPLFFPEPEGEPGTDGRPEPEGEQGTDGRPEPEGEPGEKSPLAEGGSDHRAEDLP